MALEIRYFAGAKAAAGIDTETIHATTLAEAQVVMIATHGPRLQHVLTGCSFLVDGAAHRDVAQPLPAHCTVDVLPPFAGG